MTLSIGVGAVITQGQMQVQAGSQDTEQVVGIPGPKATKRRGRKKRGGM